MGAAVLGLLVWEEMGVRELKDVKRGQSVKAGDGAASAGATVCRQLLEAG